MSNKDPSEKKRKIGEEDQNWATAENIPRSTAIISCNVVVLELLTLLKKQVLEFIGNLNIIKIWIQLNVPRIEDGNNFGVAIQEDTLNELGRAEDASFASLDSMTKYFVTRAKLVSKCLKYPGVQDYQESIMELDEKEYIDLKLAYKELRNNYAILYDMITKNLEKIEQPRSTDHRVSLY